MASVKMNNNDTFVDRLNKAVKKEEDCRAEARRLGNILFKTEFDSVGYADLEYDHRMACLAACQAEVDRDNLWKR